MNNTINIYEIEFPYRPLPHQSIKYAYKGGRRFFYVPKKVIKYKQDIRRMFIKAYPNIELSNNAFALSIIYKFKSNNKEEKYRLKRPDLTDNLSKCLIDALTGIVWKDDSLICALEAKKIDSNKDCIYLKIYEFLIN